MSVIFILKEGQSRNRLYFLMGGFIDMNVLRDFCGLPNMCSFAAFPEI